MSCKYIYKNSRVFNSELELDNFLISNKNAIKRYKDLVFDRTTSQMKSLDNLHNTHTEKIQRLKELGQSYRQAHLPKFGFDDIDYSDSTNPYIGVTQMLQDIRIEKNGIQKRLFPEFMEEDFEENGETKKGYWSRKFEEWGKVTNLESLSDDDKECLFDKNSEGQYIYTPLTQEVMNKAKQRYREKWRFQKIQGLAIHEMFNKFYENDEINKSIRRYPTDRVEEALRKKLQNVKLTVSEEGEPYKEEYFFDIMSEENFKDMVKNVLAFNNWVTKNCGYDSIFLPEFEITSTAINNAGVEVPIIGRIDLLVLDKDNNFQIFDYKVSPKEYGTDEYNDAKTRTFRYQFASYRRMLQRAGTPFGPMSKTYIVPLQMNNLKMSEDGSWAYENTKLYNGIVENLTASISQLDIEDNLQRFLPFDRKVAIKDSGNTLTKVDEFVKKSFPVFRDFQDNSLESIHKELSESKYKPLEKKNANGKYETSIYGKKIVATTPEELVKACKNHIDAIANAQGATHDNIKASFISSIKNNEGIFAYDGKISGRKNKIMQNWLSGQLGHYCTENWTVLTSEEFPGIEQLEALNIIAIQNRFTKVVDFIKISNKRIYEKIRLRGQNNLLGTYLTDQQLKSIPKELALDSCQGNIELMEIMAALNTIPSMFDNAIIGNISVINPYFEQKITTNNKQLLYNFNQLQTLGNLGENNFSINGETNKILMASTAELIRQRFNSVFTEMERSGYSGNLGNFKKFKSIVSEWDSFMRNPVILREKLLALSRQLENEFNLTGPIKELNTTPEYQIYQDIQTAIAEIDGFDFKQQLDGHDAYISNFKSILTEGWDSLMLDNPGNQQSQILNVVANTNTIAYQNTRDDVNRFMSELNPLLDNLKKSKSFSMVDTIQGEAIYFKNLTEIIGEPGEQNLVFKDPYDKGNDLTEEERQFLIFALDIINKNRGYEIDDPRYYDVPLMLGGMDSKTIDKTFIEVIKDKFRVLNPKYILNKLKQLKDKAFNYTPEKSQQKGITWEMANTFDAGEDAYTREQMLNGEGGVSKFERNVETILLSHFYAATLKNNMDKMFPTMKAAMMHLLTSRLNRNDANSKIESDIKYMEEYITAKIFNESITEYKDIEKINKKIMGVASKLALGFNPHQLYQILDGIWKDCSLIWRNVYGGNVPYTKENMKDAFFTVYKDLFTDKKSVAALINQIYAVNDMDMNVYINRVKSDQKDFDNLLFKFASRPDFYNRMTMIVARMMYDGSYNAHKSVDGKLIYDWKQDSRFSLYANDPKGENISSDQRKKWQEQKSLYIAMVRQFITEQTTTENGQIFYVDDFNDPKPLPRAYTTKQIEAMKSETDKIYGYYAHEKKSLFQSTLLGGLLMQMNTYWSSKKNQYLGKSGVYLQGDFEHYQQPVRDENGQIVKDSSGNTLYEKWYEVVDENDTPTGIYIPESQIEDKKVIPFMVWKGQFEEGIVVTLGKCLKEIWKGDETGQRGWNHMIQAIWKNEDLGIRRMYRNNIVQFLHDIWMWMIIGILTNLIMIPAVNDWKKKADKRSFGEAMLATCASEAVNMLKSSGEDFDMIHSIGNRGMNWTPFAIQTMDRTLTRFGNVIQGKTDLYDATVKTLAVGRTTEPIWDYVKLNTIGRKIGDNGKS